MVVLFLLQTAGLLSVFDAEVDRAGLTQHRVLLAAQIQQESAWDCEAQSRSAAGCAQFTAPTWGQFSVEVRPSCEGVPRTDPSCAFRVQSHYMKRLLNSYRMSATPQDQAALALAAYNGGSGWIRREKRKCKQDPRCTPNRWFGHVEEHCIRADWACRINREYPVRIMELEAGYRR
ncbi:MAG: transglycosylase SLT domain-containing protein [Acidobacteria bacterium]|nr:transglycosylase SLT domain-containing protein [Acidobacteriota bacterium]